ncbi:TetR/AcrR family transcriptional regulator [Tuberibacillus sp. Marseille-P3662]|uniref:TetR/AcrR family transcriptional regulator n=1 Tax=Tuberibacillus sp. Marseille-P3662 TaxID=1965358 RepID=UPI000A1CC5D5|nr:TetR/AcrR family transcriptional regulator [Tuberibacillus sp. Marseille-P3662]
MQTAIKRFSEQGYFKTSVQEIADDCHISKGALYKYFDSKESLLIQAFEYNHNKIFENAMAIEFDTSETPKSVLVKKLAVEIDGMIENKDFMTMLFRTFPPGESEKLKPVMERIKYSMADWHKDCLLEAYGESVQPHIWDLVVILQGILKEYLFLLMNERKPISIESLIHFLIERMDAIVLDMTHSQPLLTRKMMSDYEQFNDQDDSRSRISSLTELITQLKTTIQSISCREDEREELTATTTLLEKEMNDDEPRRFLIQALLNYLNQWEPLQQWVKRIRMSNELEEDRTHE